MFEEMTTETLESEICLLAGHLSAGQARFLALVAEFDAREAWGGYGIVSCAHWLAWRTGMGQVAAREHVRVARALRRLPDLAALFARGEVSYSKVRALTRIATEVNEAQLVEWARHGTAWQLERIVRAYRQAKAASDPTLRDRRRSVSWGYDEDGCIAIRARLAPEDGTVVLRALDAAMDEAKDEFRSDGNRDGSSTDVSAETSDAHVDAAPLAERRRADALARICESYLAEGTLLRPAGNRHLVVVHVDAETLARGRCDVDGVPLHPETARRLACDSSVLTASDEHAIGIGRRSRIVPRRMRRALRARDGACRFPSCTSRRTDAHHIVHWAHGGSTCLDNLGLLCRRHHRAVHEGGFTMESLGEGTFVFRRPDGRAIETMPARGEPGVIERANERAGLGITPETCASDWDGRRPDYGVAVWGLMMLDERAASDGGASGTSERPDYWFR